MTATEIKDLRQIALATFEKDLPQLWVERPGQWVAYRGAEQLGFASQKHVVYQQCLQRGLDGEEFVVFCIGPQETEMFLSPLMDM
jgi:hypothetical protein